MRVVCGVFWGKRGPVDGIAARIRDVSDPRDVRVEDPNHHGEFMTEYAGNRSMVLFDRGDEVVVESGDEGARFPVVSGEPLKDRSRGADRS